MIQQFSQLSSAVSIVSTHFGFMAWNSFLAFVPLAIALWFYGRRRELAIGVAAICGVLLLIRLESVVHNLKILVHTLQPIQICILLGLASVIVMLLLVARWRAQALQALATAAFFITLPNALYVLTDVLHFFEVVRSTHSVSALIVTAVPLYAVFMGLGFVSYVVSLSFFSNSVLRRYPSVSKLWIELPMHLICAFGVYLGRFDRLNSWDIATQPLSVLEHSLKVLLSPNAVVVVVLSFVFTWLLFSLCRVVLWALHEFVNARSRALGGLLAYQEKGSA